MSDDKKSNSVNVSGTIYGSTLITQSKLILDVRNQEKQTISYVNLDLKTFKMTDLPITNTAWWTKLIAADTDFLYLIKYLDRNDPNSQVFVRLSLKENVMEEIEEIPPTMPQVTYPTLYETGTDYHKTVADFLGLELPLSCEYLEWQEKIILSYYLRSGNAFDRFLLLLDNGKKEWKLHQDQQMKGFSPGAFFVYNDQMIFFKELNEVCIYTV